MNLSFKIFISVLLALPLLLVAAISLPPILLLAQEEPPEPERRPVEIIQTIKKWSYAHYVNNTLYWQCAGDLAKIIGQKEIQAKGITLTYYLDINEGVSAITNKFVIIRADEGVIKKETYFAEFKGNVHITMPIHEPKNNSILSEWNMLTHSVNILGLAKGAKNHPKEEKDIVITSNTPVTLTQTNGMTVTAISFSAINRNVIASSKEQNINQATFREAHLVRSPASSIGGTANTTEGKEITINAEIMELFNSTNEEEIIVLKGKKDVSIYNKSPINSASVSPTTKSPYSSSIFWITAEGNTLIYPQFNKILFQNKVQMVNSSETPGTGSQPVTTTSKGILRADTMNMFFDTEKSEIRKAIAEKNIILFNQNNDYVKGEMLEWVPEKHVITIKSHNKVKIFSQNNLSSADEVNIYTGANSPETMGNWEKIELKGGGTIKIK
jgi:hypothetical protein